jgi:hypothetical protein
MIMKFPFGKPKINTMAMGMHRIVKQRGKINPENQTKIVTFEKLLTVTPN